MIITQTPLRISFLGGGTDFPDFYKHEEGCVISTAIDKYIYVIVKERFDDKIYVNYSRKEIVSHVNELEHELAREAMRLTGVHDGVELTFLADVPSEGTGLGSSSAVTVGLLHALYTYLGQIRPAEELAAEACRIELEILGKPIGKQDQYIAALGGMREIAFCPSGQVVHEPLAVPNGDAWRLQQQLLLFYTNRTRQAASVLAEQQQNIPHRLAELRALRDLAHAGRNLLLDGNYDDFGRLLHKGWTLKRQLASKISDEPIDSLYARAHQAGALGGKIVGAGGGGFLLLYVPLECQDHVRTALAPLRELPFRFERDGTKVIFNVRR